MSDARITKNDRFNQLLAIDEVGANQELCEFILHEQDLIARKHNAKSGPTKTQLANAVTKVEIVEVISDGTHKATDIANTLGLSVQKVTALLRQMVLDGTVQRVENGKVVTFTL